MENNQETMAPVSLPATLRYKGFQNTIRSVVSHPKDWVPLLSKSGIVFKVEWCCCNALYAGDTNWRLESRLAEHQRVLQTGEINVSAVVEHVWNSGHHINWDPIAILGINCRHYPILARFFSPGMLRFDFSNHRGKTLVLICDLILSCSVIDESICQASVLLIQTLVVQGAFMYCWEMTYSGTPCFTASVRPSGSPSALKRVSLGCLLVVLATNVFLQQPQHLLHLSVSSPK